MTLMGSLFLILGIIFFGFGIVPGLIPTGSMNLASLWIGVAVMIFGGGLIYGGYEPKTS